jgi:endonuclease YncB( thermonuclease family)
VPGFDLVIASVNGIEPQPAVAYRRDSPENQVVIAFELFQLEGRPWRCAQHVALGLPARLEGQVVTCCSRDRDRFGRIVATCKLKGADLGSWLVSEGLAYDYVYYSKGASRCHSST